MTTEENSIMIKHRSEVDPGGWCTVFFTKAGLIEKGLDPENDVLVGGFINQTTGEFRWYNPERFKPDEYVDIFGFHEEIKQKGWVLYSYNDDKKKCKIKVLKKDGKYREIENPGCINGRGYPIIRIILPNGKRIYFKTHKLHAWLAFPTPEGIKNYSVDHKNRDKEDARVENLRYALPTTQSRNQTRPEKIDRTEIIYYNIKTKKSYDKNSLPVHLTTVGKCKDWVTLYGKAIEVGPKFLLEEEEWIAPGYFNGRKQGIYIGKKSGILRYGTIYTPGGYKKRDGRYYIKFNRKTYPVSYFIGCVKFGKKLGDYSFVIDHVNSNPCDNRWENLKLVFSAKENMNNPNTRIKQSRPVVRVKDGIVLGAYFSATYIDDIKSNNISNISSCCSGKRKSHAGFEWFYYEDWIERFPESERDAVREKLDKMIEESKQKFIEKYENKERRSPDKSTIGTKEKN